MRIISGYFILALSVILFLSLVSFNLADSAFFVSNMNTNPDNIAGSFGVWIGSPLVLLYGKYGSFLLDFGLFTIGINILIKTKIGRILLKITLFIISAVSLSVVVSIIFTKAGFADTGIVGPAFVKSLSEVIHPYIILIIFSTVLILSLSSSMKLFQRITYWLAKLFGNIILAPFELFGLVIRGRNSENNNRENKILNDKRGYDFIKDEYDDLYLNPYDNSGRVSAKVPDFLRSSSDGSSVKLSGGPDGSLNNNISNDNSSKFYDSGNMNANTISGVIDEAPSWLKENEGKQGILSSIKEHFDKELDIEAINHSVKTPDYHEIEPERLDQAVLTEEDKEIKNDEEQNSRINGEDELEIVGEADYTLEAKSRQNENEIENIEEETFSSEEAEQNDYIFPDMTILEKSFDEFSKSEESQEIERISRIIENTFASFKIDIKVSGYSKGPAITRYEIVPPAGLKLKNIVNLTDDLALNLGTRNIRIVAPIGNRSIVGVEVPNKFRKNVVLRDIIESDDFIKTKAKLPLILGKDIAGNIVVEDLTEMPHLLIAGTTGSGKSVYVNSLIGGIVFTKTSREVKFIFIDPKMVELELYNGIPHLLAPVITSPEEAIGVLEWVSAELDRRYKILSEFSVRNIVDYNKEIKKINVARKNNNESQAEFFPYIIVVIDEFANLMLRLPKETEKIISRIAAMARAVGIHLVVATQRPSVDVVTGIIKANFPSRIAFRVSSQTDSRTILDKNGAERLLGRGDMLFMTPNFTDMIRIQSPFVSNADVESIVKELKRNGTADYEIDLENLRETQGNTVESDFSVDYRQDPVFIESLKAAAENGEISASYLQRRFRIGYNRASRIIEAFEKMKILGPSTGTSKPREVLVRQEDLVNYIE